MRSMIWRILWVGLAGLAVLLLIAAYSARSLMLASLPLTEGEQRMPSLTAEVVIERDASSIPTIRGSSLEDACRAQGFATAQDRFFQMDLMRRNASGRLSELFGGATLERDRGARRLGLTRVAGRVLQSLPREHAALLSAYTQGVNAGLRALRVRPPEYLILRQQPAPWQAEDCMLVLLTMMEELESDTRYEVMKGVMVEALPPSLVEFLTPVQSRFDAPMIREAGWAPKPPPGPEVFDVRAPPSMGAEELKGIHGKGTRGSAMQIGAFAQARAALDDAEASAGSNAFVIAGSRTAHGGAILANDMHLSIGMPNTWYRAALEWTADGATHRCEGVTLPGVPCIVAGSNGSIAWGFTNVTGDFRDFVQVVPDPRDPSQYMTPEGQEPFTEETEELLVRGGSPERLTLRRTRWGVITRTDWKGRPLALRWIGLEPQGVNMRLFDMMTATALEQAVEIARAWRGPPQNVMIASRDGRIAWTISGMLPNRAGFDGSFPVPWSAAGVGWFGTLDEVDRPLIIDPPEGFLVTANQRTMPTEAARRIGLHWSLGVRAGRLQELLAARSAVTEADALAFQLDTRAPVFDFYRELIMRAVPESAGGAVGQARALVRDWNGTSDADQTGFRLLAEFRRRAHNEIIEALAVPCKALDPSFRYEWLMREEPMRAILETGAIHLMPAGASSTDEYARRVFERVAEELGQSERLNRAWGDANASDFRHPFASVMPGLRETLSLTQRAQPGHTLSVRVTAPTFGASERLAVSPGREDVAILHMPGGQSGHWLSKHASDQHDAWAEGKPTPLRPGAPAGRLRLKPAGSAGP